MFGRSIKLAVAAAICLPLFGDVITYNDLASWNARTTQTGTTIDFTALAPNPGNDMKYTSVTQNGVTFSSVGHAYINAMNGGSIIPWMNWGSGAVLSNYEGGSGIEAVFVNPISSFSLDLMINNGWPPSLPSQMTVTGGLGATQLFSIAWNTNAYSTRTFFGLTSATNLDWIRFTPAVNYAIIDNFAYGTYNPGNPPPPPPPDPEEAAEPATLLLVGTALLVFGRRFRHNFA